MINGKKVVVVLPAYNAEATLEATYREIPMPLVDEVVLVDDCSSDATVSLAQQLGIRHILAHDQNRGYGANQKTCYRKALELNADIIIMLHPDYQYTPKLIPAMASVIAEGLYDVVLGSRILGTGALRGGMPLYKYVFNRLLTLIQNVLLQQKLSEYHTGYRAFSRKALTAIRWQANSDDFVFDNQVISQLFMAGFEIAEITCPTRYFKEASSINFTRSIVYGLGVLHVSLRHFLHRHGLLRWHIYQPPAATP
ncbi:MAG: glycosyltransferase family 2 protein [Chitinophagales bacterium]|nr:glycosyltransferase family 2 protein [Chitinophagales bacterium]MDW8392729.1 glycosyltransferase family 2 protein [Chitinophagales bacterium]